MADMDQPENFPTPRCRRFSGFLDRRFAARVTPHAGGDGALGDAVEFILKAQGKWKKVLEAYLGEKSGKKLLAISS
jgi:hypothetical protein